MFGVGQELRITPRVIANEERKTMKTHGFEEAKESGKQLFTLGCITVCEGCTVAATEVIQFTMCLPADYAAATKKRSTPAANIFQHHIFQRQVNAHISRICVYVSEFVAEMSHAPNIAQGQSAKKLN